MMALQYKRIPNDTLSFQGKPLRSGRHKIHPYPAMLHPLLVDYLIDKYANQGDVIFDPFCGTGVTLFQAAIKGYESFGFDINPFALLIAKTKMKKYSADLIEEFNELKTKIRFNQLRDMPEIHNKNYWYKDDVANDLAKIKYVIKQDWKYKDFFLTCFALTCRNQSLTRNGEFKRYRISKDKVKENKVFNVFFKHTEDMIRIFFTSSFDIKMPSLYLKNSECKINPRLRYNLVITSPPYGDSMTTVAYGQFSSFGSEWTCDINPFGKVEYKIDNEGLGKKNTIYDDIYTHPLLTEKINQIKERDVRRSNAVLYFFNGYYKSIKNIVNNLKNNGKICVIVGNRTVKGYEIPMDQITASFLESLGLNFEKILMRKISNKVMPSQNSPINKVGMKSNTMKEEYIVIFSKK